MAAIDTFSVDAFLDLPRVDGLALSPEGGRLVTSVATRTRDGKRMRTALYAVDPQGRSAPAQLTRSRAGETAPAFLPDGRLLFTSPRPDPDAPEKGNDHDQRGGDEVAGLWELPEAGEARLLAAPSGGVSSFAVARDRGTVAVVTGLHPEAGDWTEDAEQARARRDAGVTAQLFSEFPIRFWDRWLGPRRPQLFAATDPDGAWVPLTPDPGFALERAQFDLTPDGGMVVTTRWQAGTEPRDRVPELVAIPFDGSGAGEPRVLATEARVSYESPACSPDGARVVAVRVPLGSPDAVPDRTLVLVDVEGAAGPRDLLPGFDRWPQAPVWAPDGRAVYFTADDGGHCLPFKVTVDDGEVTRLASHGAFTHLVPAPDGNTVFALRSSLAEPPHVVALDSDAPSRDPRPIPTPGDDRRPPGRVERVNAQAADGVGVPGWLVLPPEDDGPAPLVVFVHGGPLNSWNAWHWRWNPHVLAARGWAVLLPDPALSTGYGIDFIRRGWGRWGAEPYTDIMAITDHVEARADIDGDRTAVMGGSFGGYMANWIAGHTDRFRGIVTHASLWNLEAFHGTTDLGAWWENEFGDRYEHPERYREWSPHRFVDRISTPMLVIHGEQDFRVPVSESLTLWTDLKRHGAEAMYLHFPDEHHWVLAPQHSRLWYEVVIAFLEHYVLGKPWKPPDLVG